jgi:hypothetical protein
MAEHFDYRSDQIPFFYLVFGAGHIQRNYSPFMQQTATGRFMAFCSFPGAGVFVLVSLGLPWFGGGKNHCQDYLEFFKKKGL